MSQEEVAGTFLSGGFRSVNPTVELPDPNDVTRGALYCDENGQVWKLAVTRPDAQRTVARWVSVTVVSEEKQKRDHTFMIVFVVAALAVVLLVNVLVRQFDFSFPWELLLGIGGFSIFAGLWWMAMQRIDRQVVLPAERISS